jgi:dUTP pyrophosphatase
VSSLKTKFIKLHPEAIKPLRAKEGDAGYDLFAVETTVIQPFERKLIRTGIAAQIPHGYYGRLAPRSGLAFKNGLDVMAGVIDSGYRDEIKVLLINLDVRFLIEMLRENRPSEKAYNGLFGLPGSFRIQKGDRIAQIIIENCACVDWQETDTLEESERAKGGFGSTGNRAADDGVCYETDEKSPKAS